MRTTFRYVRSLSLSRRISIRRYTGRKVPGHERGKWGSRNTCLLPPVRPVPRSRRRSRRHAALVNPAREPWPPLSIPRRTGPEVEAGSIGWVGFRRRSHAYPSPDRIPTWRAKYPRDNRYGSWRRYVFPVCLWTASIGLPSLRLPPRLPSRYLLGISFLEKGAIAVII